VISQTRFTTNVLTSSGRIGAEFTFRRIPGNRKMPPATEDKEIQDGLGLVKDCAEPPDRAYDGRSAAWIPFSIADG
jgi:hypothetical protein